MSILSFSLQGWNDFWQGLAVVSLAIAFIAGYGANRTGKKMAKLQDREITQLKASAEKQKGTNLELAGDLEKQREKTAKAEAATLELSRLIHRPRAVNWDKSLPILQNGPKGSAEIVFVADNLEAEVFAFEIHSLLATSGWKVSFPVVRTGKYVGPANVGVTIIGSLKETTPPNDPHDPLSGLPETSRVVHKALRESGMSPVGWAGTSTQPIGTIVVNVGPKF